MKTASTNTNFREDEVNLAEVFEKLLLHKWKILCGTLALIFVTSLHYTLEPTLYEAESLILISRPIGKPDDNSVSGSKISEISVSELAPSAYLILAKSDELMRALAETLLVRLPAEKIKKISNSNNVDDLTIALIGGLQVELLQSTGERNPHNNTPLLSFKHQSYHSSLPPDVVNIWSDLFIERNQGLSSNITEEFYQEIISQYEQAKYNLELKESELINLDAAFNTKKWLETEQTFKASLLENAIEKYQLNKTNLDDTIRRLKHVSTAIEELEHENRWIGSSNIDISSIDNEQIRSIVHTSSAVRDAAIDSSVLEERYKSSYEALKDKHANTLRIFEEKHQATYQRKQLESLILRFEQEQSELLNADEEIDRLNALANAISSTMSEQKAKLITRHATVNETLMESLKYRGELDWEEYGNIGDNGIISEKVNPVYLKLDDSLSTVKTRLYFVEKRLAHAKENRSILSKKISELSENLKSLSKLRTDLDQELAAEKEDLIENFSNDMREVNNTLSVLRISLNAYLDFYEGLKSERSELDRSLFFFQDAAQYYGKDYSIWQRELVSLSAKIDSITMERKRINRDKTVYEESFNRFAKLKEEARIARQQAAGDIQVISRAIVAKALPDPNMTIVFAVSGLVGLVIMGFSVLIFESLKRIRKLNDASVSNT